ncbi:hypothetical protein VE04_06892 [Pseudogymnoascus sp. 24MN13]|nr:hypothetical protein VE04_06892 [Pseudogymnoascus sp. 24MN13]
MAPAPVDGLSPPGSSTYSSNTLYVGDGTWDSQRNTFLLPNLVGLNFETMRYNGMGNRFASQPQYHYLIRAHGIIAVIVFLLLIPTSILMSRFYGKIPGRGVRVHIYLNILALFLSTVVFILGFMAVGPSRSLTNPHHGLGVAIYVLIIWQTLVGNWIRKKFKKKMYRRPPIKLMIHQWMGRATAILGIIQVPLGLVLYGSPKWTFILYTLWMTFLLIFYFIAQHRAYGDTHHHGAHGDHLEGGTVIEEKKSGGWGKYLAPLAAGAGAVWLGKKFSHRHDDDDEVVPSRRRLSTRSRRDSASYFTEDEKPDHKEGGGLFKKLMLGAAVAGAGIFAKKKYDKRHAHDDEYSAVAGDTPSRRPSRRHDHIGSDYTESTIEVRRADDRPGHSKLLPAAGGAALGALGAAAIGAAKRPRTPPPVKSPRRNPRRDSFDTYTSIASPSRVNESGGHGARNGILAGLGLGWLGKKFKDRKDDREHERLDDIRRQELEDEKRLEAERRYGNRPPRYTGDGHRPPRRHDYDEESDLSSDFTSLHPRRAGDPIPPSNLGPGAPPVLIGAQGSRHDIVDPVPMPTGPPRDGHDRFEDPYLPRRQSSRSRRDAEAAAASAGSVLAASEVDRRRHRSRSQGGGYRDDERDGSRPSATVKVRVRPEDVALQRLTREEAAERAARRRRRHSLSDSEVSAGPSGRYRRDESASRQAAERRAERRAEADLEPLSPPRPAFAKGRAKDSAYYSGPSGGSGRPSGPESIGSPDSGPAYSGMSPTGTGMSEDPAERRRRRRAERSRAGGPGGSPEFT